MKKTFIASILAAILMVSGGANAEGTCYASEYTGGYIMLGYGWEFNKMFVDTPLTLTGDNGYLELYKDATIVFRKNTEDDSLCSISTSEEIYGYSVFFNNAGAVYNISFIHEAKSIVIASAGTPITLIEDLNKDSGGFDFYGISPSETILKLEGAGYNETVEMNGISFKYVGPKPDDYVFMQGEIGFTGYYTGSHALKLVVGGPAVPEPATGSLSLLALAGLCARRRRK